MENIDIKMDYNDNRKLSYSISDGYCPITTIREDFLENGELKKDFRLCRWDDYGFTSYVDADYDEYMEMKEVSYTFEPGHPLYIPFFHLLKGDKELLIDDDETYQENMKYMIIYIDNDIITLKFVNNLEEDESIERFHVFIKNIGFDLRSKIDCNDLDTKERLFNFFNEVNKLFMEENHQITMEEYMLDKPKKLERK